MFSFFFWVSGTVLFYVLSLQSLKADVHLLSVKTCYRGNNQTQWHHLSFCCSFDLEQCRKTRGVADIQTCWKTLFKKTTTKYYGYKKYKKVQKHCWKITSDDSFWVGTVAVIEIQTHDVMSRLGERSTAASHWIDYIINRPFRKKPKKPKTVWTRTQRSALLKTWKRVLPQTPSILSWTETLVKDDVQLFERQPAVVEHKRI